VKEGDGDVVLPERAVPVPRVRVLCEDPEVLGSAFYLMDFVEGRILGDQTLPEMTVDERRALYDDMNRVIAELHRVDVAAPLREEEPEAEFLQLPLGEVRERLRDAPAALKFFDPTCDWAPRTDFDYCTEVDRFDFVLRLRRTPGEPIELERLNPGEG